MLCRCWRAELSIVVGADRSKIIHTVHLEERVINGGRSGRALRVQVSVETGREENFQTFIPYGTLLEDYSTVIQACRSTAEGRKGNDIEMRCKPKRATPIGLPSRPPETLTLNVAEPNFPAADATVTPGPQDLQ